MKELYSLIYAEDEDWAMKEGINEDLLLVSLRSLRYHSMAKIILFLPLVKKQLSTETLYYLTHKLLVEPIYIPEKKWRNRRMLCRLEQFGALLTVQSENTCLISGEVDEIFLSDPFEFFKQDFDLGLSARSEGATIPINAGLVFFKNSENIFRLYCWLISQIVDSNWKTYLNLKHKKNTFDVYCDRDLWWSVWLDHRKLKKLFKVDIRLLDCGYLMDEAIQEGKCSFHLKSHSKKRIYEPNFHRRISTWLR